MTDFFVDTSALAKHYVIETGTKWVRSWVRPSAHNEIVISELSMVEMFALVERRQRMGTIKSGNAIQIRSAFVRHLKSEYVSIQIDSALLHAARKLVRKHPLRTLDAIQLACALRAASMAPQKSFTFVSADNDLLAAASGEGFPVDNPNIHP